MATRWRLVSALFLLLPCVAAAQILEPPRLITPFAGRAGSATPTWGWDPPLNGTRPDHYIVRTSWLGGEVGVPASTSGPTIWGPTGAIPTGLQTIWVRSVFAQEQSAEVSDQIRILPFPPKPILVKGYSGASTLERRPVWSWTPDPATQEITHYTIATVGPGFSQPTTWLDKTVTSWSPPVDLQPGVHKFEVRAHNVSGLGALAEDTVNVSLAPPQKVTVEFTEPVSVVPERVEKTSVSFQITTGDERPTQALIRVTCRFLGVTATAKVEFDDAPVTVDVSAGSLNGTKMSCPVVLHDDVDKEDLERLTVELVPAGADPGRQFRHELFIVDNEVAAVEVTSGFAPWLSTAEWGEARALGVKLASRPPADVRVSLRTTELSEGFLYNPTKVNSDGSREVWLTFSSANWSVAQQVVVAGRDDDFVDGNQGFMVEVTAWSDHPAYNGAPIVGNTFGVNVDNDWAAVVPSATSVSLAEGGTATVNLRLPSAPRGAVTLGLPEVPARIKASLSGTEITSANWSTGVDLKLVWEQNAVDDRPGRFLLHPTLTSSDPVYGRVVPPAIELILAEDDDLPALVVEPSSGLTVQEGDKVPGKLKVSLTGPPPTGLTSIPVVSSSSRVKVPGSLPVSASSWSNLEVPVTVEPDSRADLPASATITVGQGLAGMTAVSASVRVLDDDPLLFTLPPDVTAEVTLNEETSKTYTLALTGAAPGTLTLKATSSDPRVTATLGKTTVTATDWSSGISLTVTASGNTVDEADVSLLVTVEAEGSGAPPARILRFLRKDDDLPAYMVEPASGLTVREEDSVPARLKVSLTSPPPAGLTAIPVISNSSRVKVPGTLPVNASNWSNLEVPVTVEPDSRADQPATVTITIGQRTDGTRANAAMTPVSVNVRVLDDDVPGISFHPSTLRLDEPGGSRVFTVFLTSQSAVPVRIPLNPEPPGRFRLSENPVVFPAGTMQKDVEVTVEDDSDVDGLETVRIWLDPAESDDGGYAGRNPAGPLYVEVISADDDVADQPPPAPPLFTLSPGVAGEILLDEGASKAYKIGLTGPAWGMLTLKATSSEPRVTATLGKTSVSTADWTAGVSLTVATAGNTVDEADVSALVTLEAEGPGAPPARILRFLRKDDDLPALLVVPSSGLTVREGDSVPGKLKVSLTGPPPASLTSIPMVSSSSRVKVPGSLPVSASSWSNLEVPVTVEPDSRADLPSSATITVGQGLTGMTAVPVDVRVLDDDPLLLTLSPDVTAETTLNEETSKTYTLGLTGAAPGALTLKATSSDPRVTATLGRTIVSPENWASGVSLTVATAGNTVDEADVSVLVTLEAEGPGAPPARILRFLRKDDDLPALLVEPSSGLTVREGDSVPGKLKVSLTGPPPTGLTSIPVVSSSSRVKVPGSLLVSASSWSNLEVPVTVEPDNRADLPASATITVGQGLTGMTAVPVDVRVLDDDPLLLTLSPDVTAETTLNEETSKTYTLGLTGAAPGALTLKATSSDPRVTATLGRTFVTATDWASGISLTVAAPGNTVDEADVSVLVVLEAVGAGAPPSRILGFLVRDDDLPVPPEPGVTVEPTEGVIAVQGASPGVFHVRLRSRPTANVTFPLSLSRPDEARLSSESLVFTPENWEAVQEVRVSGRHPSEDPPTVHTVAVGAAASSDPRYSQLDPPDVRVTGLESSGYEVTPLTGLTTTEGGRVARFNVAVPVQPRTDLRIPLAVSDPDEATVTPRELVFTPRDWDIPRTVQVKGLDDDVVDGPRTFAVQVGPIQTEDPGLKGRGLPSVEVVNLDDDVDDGGEAERGGDFYTLLPCRVLDTRQEGGPLKPGEVRALKIQGRCGIPQGARAVAFNVTAVQATADGWIELFPGDLAAPPGTRVVSFQPAANRACQAVLALSADGTGTLAARPELPADGSVHLVLDVVGWFD